MPTTSTGGRRTRRTGRPGRSSWTAPAPTAASRSGARPSRNAAAAILARTSLVRRQQALFVTRSCRGLYFGESPLAASCGRLRCAAARVRTIRAIGIRCAACVLRCFHYNFYSKIHRGAGGARRRCRAVPFGRLRCCGWPGACRGPGPCRSYVARRVAGSDAVQPVPCSEQAVSERNQNHRHKNAQRTRRPSPTTHENRTSTTGAGQLLAWRRIPFSQAERCVSVASSTAGRCPSLLVAVSFASRCAALRRER